MSFCNQVGLINIFGCITMKNQTGQFVSCLSKRIINREQNYLQNLIKVLLLQANYSHTNWTDAGRKFSVHQASDAHKDVHRARFSNTEDIDELMCDIHAGQKRENKYCFLKILSSVRLLAR